MRSRAHLRAYRDILNDAISEAASGAPFPTASSNTGATSWTASEKDALFRRLPLVGPGDLLALCEATGKSEAEVQSYLSLLQSNAAQFDQADVPAALDISDLEPDLEKIADTLSRRVLEHDIQTAKDEYGEHEPWLIDQEVAAAIEEYRAAEEEIQTESGDEAEVKEESSPADDGDVYSQMITLLRPESFLDLSKTLFMNSSADEDMNWATCPRIDDEIDKPSIFRSAFEDIYNLAIFRIRRVVQASIFQAMSRLRASDSSRPDWDPLAVVREADVHAALDLLNMKADRDKYWSEVARRCQVKVYSDSKKYADGRPGTKTGRELTWEEAEAELTGAEKSREGNDLAIEEIFDEDVEEFLEDDENFTEVSEDEEPDHSSVKDEDDESRSRSRSRSWKRKRALSAASFGRVETKYLEALDHNASVEEARRLEDLLKLDNTRGFKLRKRERQTPLEHSGPLPEAEKAAADWHDRTEYQADWEHPMELVDEEAFRETDHQGDLGRKRRQALFKRAQRRFTATHGLDEADDIALSEATDDDRPRVNQDDDKFDDDELSGGILSESHEDEETNPDTASESAPNHSDFESP